MIAIATIRLKLTTTPATLAPESLGAPRNCATASCAPGERGSGRYARKRRVSEGVSQTAPRRMSATAA